MYQRPTLSVRDAMMIAAGVAGVATRKAVVLTAGADVPQEIKEPQAQKWTPFEIIETTYSGTLTDKCYNAGYFADLKTGDKYRYKYTRLDGRGFCDVPNGTPASFVITGPTTARFSIPSFNQSFDADTRTVPSVIPTTPKSPAETKEVLAEKDLPFLSVIDTKFSGTLTDKCSNAGFFWDLAKNERYGYVYTRLDGRGFCDVPTGTSAQFIVTGPTSARFIIPSLDQQFNADSMVAPRVIPMTPRLAADEKA